MKAAIIREGLGSHVFCLESLKEGLVLNYGVKDSS